MWIGDHILKQGIRASPCYSLPWLLATAHPVGTDTPPAHSVNPHATAYAGCLLQPTLLSVWTSPPPVTPPPLPQVYHEEWGVSRTPWYTMICFSLALVLGAAAYLERLQARMLAHKAEYSHLAASVA